MYERLLDKNHSPSPDFIRDYIGTESYNILLQFDDILSNNYHLTKELKFPFGNNYGWGYKYSHKSSHLCYAFFESGTFTITLQLGDNCISKIKQIMSCLSSKGIELWNNRYPCGMQGGWIHYRVLDKNDLNDIFEFIKVKKKPAKLL
jgi:hypothetical protein